MIALTFLPILLQRKMKSNLVEAEIHTDPIVLSFYLISRDKATALFIVSLLKGDSKPTIEISHKFEDTRKLAYRTI